jgi:hypothetical protein
MTQLRGDFRNFTSSPIKQRNSEKNASRCHVVRHNFPIDYHGAETGLHGAKGAFNRLSHGTVWPPVLSTSCSVPYPVGPAGLSSSRSIRTLSLLYVC